MVYAGVLVKFQNLVTNENTFPGKAYNGGSEKNKIPYVLLVPMVIQPWSPSGSTPKIALLVLGLLSYTKFKVNHTSMYKAKGLPFIEARLKF